MAPVNGTKSLLKIKTKSMQKDRQGIAMLPALIIGAVLVVVIGGIAWVKVQKIEPTETETETETLTISNVNTSSDTNTPEENLVNTVVNASETVSVTNPPGVLTYESEKLGVKFNYLEAEGSPIIEEGDKIYVGGKNGGQWVEVFSKSKGDDLKTAVKKQFLSGISEKDCVVEDYKTSWLSDAVSINFGFQNKGWNDSRIQTSPCPEDYRETNGIRYFWMDSSNPEKFFFFSIGQYAIRAEGTPGDAKQGDKTWQETFETVE